VCNLAKQLVLDSNLVGAAKRFLAYRVAEIVNDSNDHDFWAKPEKLAVEVGLDPGTVRKYLRAMVERDLLVVLEEGGGRSRSTRYRFVGCAEAHAQKPRLGARNEGPEESRPPARNEETAPGVHETAPGVHETAPPGAAIGEQEREPNEPEPSCATDVARQDSRASDSATEEGPKPPRVRRTFKADFEVFWEEYPRKLSKKAAAKRYDVVRRDGASAEDLLAGLDLYKRTEWFTREPDTIPYPATWLNAFDPSELQSSPTPTTDDEMPGSGHTCYVPEGLTACVICKEEVLVS
jgi:hypothetical protein